MSREGARVDLTGIQVTTFIIINLFEAHIQGVAVLFIARSFQNQLKLGGTHG